MNDENRWINIETKVAHQEHMIDELNQVIYEQQKNIDKLEEKFNLLVKRFKDAATGDIEIGAANEKPPHY